MATIRDGQSAIADRLVVIVGMSLAFSQGGTRSMPTSRGRVRGSVAAMQGALVESAAVVPIAHVSERRRGTPQNHPAMKIFHLPAKNFTHFEKEPCVLHQCRAAPKCFGWRAVLLLDIPV